MSSPQPIVGADADSLAQEPFPVELDHLRPPPESAVKSGAEKPPGVEVSTVNGKSLFERMDHRLAEKVVADEKMSPQSREQYRRLAAVLHDAQANTGLRIVMIASAVPGEGKTLTATNLALTLSESYQERVLLIDADLRKPALHQMFHISAATGLIEGLRADGATKLVLRQVSSRLTVLPAGRPTSDPMAAFTSERMRQLLAEARETFDWVIIDTPPLVLLSDAHLLSPLVDGAVLVVRANGTPHDLVRRAADIIGRNRIAGVVLNQAEALAQPGYNARHHRYYQGDVPKLEGS
jgi:protein-tyrosine kinase